MTQRCSDVLDHVHRAIQDELRLLRERAGTPLSLLDVGCWDGIPTAAYLRILGGRAHGIEVFPEQAALARAKGIETAEVDLETGTFPWGDASIDVAVVNQVFEHLKNVWLPISEIARVLRPGGHLVFSVPNLSSFHNRVMLAFGFQPSSIRTFGPHVRGYTYRQMRQFVTFGGCFAIERVRGIGFYPLNATLGAPFASMWKGGCHTPVIVARRAPTERHDPWLANARQEPLVGQQTHYASL